MQFIVWTNSGADTFSGDATYRLLDNGGLVVKDPARDKQTTYSPAGWFRLEQQHQKSAYSGSAKPVAVSDDTGSAALGGF